MLQIVDTLLKKKEKETAEFTEFRLYITMERFCINALNSKSHNRVNEFMTFLNALRICSVPQFAGFERV